MRGRVRVVGGPAPSDTRVFKINPDGTEQDISGEVLSVELVVSASGSREGGPHGRLATAKLEMFAEFDMVAEVAGE